MRVLLVVSSHRYTGAAAAAEHYCRALQAAGADAELLFIGGDNLEERLRGFEWALPLLRKERSPARLRTNLDAIRARAAAADAVICHLPHDHTLCRLAGVHRLAPLVRNFRNPKHVRGGLLERRLNRTLSGALFANRQMLDRFDAAATRPVPTAAFPVPLEERFRPGAGGARWRRELRIAPSSPVLGMVGKLARGRGFDTLLETAAGVGGDLHVIVVGHGEARPALEALATSLGLSPRVHWLGYRGRELPGLYAAMDVVLFPTAGSDHGHRAVSEAQGCGRPVVAADLPGVADLIEDGVTGRIVPGSVRDLAAAVAALLADPAVARRLGDAAAAAVAPRRFPAVGRRLAAFLEGLAGPPAV